MCILFFLKKSFKIQSLCMPVCLHMCVSFYRFLCLPCSLLCLSLSLYLSMSIVFVSPIIIQDGNTRSLCNKTITLSIFLSWLFFVDPASKAVIVLFSTPGISTYGLQKMEIKCSKKQRSH